MHFNLSNTEILGTISSSGQIEIKSVDHLDKVLNLKELLVQLLLIEYIRTTEIIKSLFKVVWFDGTIGLLPTLSVFLVQLFLPVVILSNTVLEGIHYLVQNKLFL